MKNIQELDKLDLFKSTFEECYDKEKSNSNKTVLRYTIMVAGAVVLLVLLKLAISHKKK